MAIGSQLGVMLCFLVEGHETESLNPNWLTNMAIAGLSSDEAQNFGSSNESQ